MGHGFGVDAGMEIGREVKSNVCKRIWAGGIGTRPAIRTGVTTLQALRSDRCKPIALRRLEVTPQEYLKPARQNPHGRRESTLNDLRRPFLPEESNQFSVISNQ